MVYRVPIYLSVDVTDQFAVRERAAALWRAATDGDPSLDVHGLNIERALAIVLSSPEVTDRLRAGASGAGIEISELIVESNGIELEVGRPPTPDDILR